MLVPYDPSKSLQKFFEDDFFSPFFSSNRQWPRTNVRETDNEVIVDMELPGMKADDISVSAKGKVLRIKGETKEEQKEQKEDYYRREFKRGYCQRTIGLPSRVKGAKAKAKYEDGILTVTLPKEEEDKDDGVEIKVEK